MNEGFVQLEGAKDAQIVAKETTLTDDILVNMLGHIPHADEFPEGIASIEKKALVPYGGNLPDFMKTFLERMKLAAESHRQGNAGDIRKVI